MTKYLLAILGVLVIVILVGWHHVSAQSETITKQRVTIDQMAADAAWQAQQLKARDSVDAQYQDNLKKVQDEKQALVARLDTGTQRVYVRATCPKLPNTSTPGSPDAGIPELEPAARQDYANLRAANDSARAQIGGLQSYIKNVCLKGQVK